MVTEHFDIVVIGAGIQGAGIAQAAASYGYRVLVLEKTAVAAGTSSRSSKLIHGGLRYLETAQFALVRECLYERNLLLRLAPELVRMRPFYIPVYKQSSRTAAKIGLGLGIYAILNGMHASSRFAVVAPRHWDRLDGLTTAGLRKVFRYQDAQTDDRELTKAVLQSALGLGVELRMPARFVGASIGATCEVRYEDNRGQHVCTASLLINAAGPWVAEVLSNITPQQAPLPLDLVQGTHIVLRQPMSESVYYLEAPQDRRAVFVMPWKNHTLVGTTETQYGGEPDMVTPLSSEVEYLLEAYRNFFPAMGGEESNAAVIDQFAGLRVLPAAGGSAFRRPRDTMVQLDDPGNPRVASVYGGKLTAYRATADKIMRRLLPALPRKRHMADTRRLPLCPVDAKQLS